MDYEKAKTKSFEEMTPEEKVKLAAEHKQKHMEWLHFIIKDKQQSLSEYQGKPRQCRILSNEIKNYEKELSILQGFTQVPSEFDAMSAEMKALYDKLINKQVVLVACKKDVQHCEYVRAEIRVIERQIKDLELQENPDKPIDDLPF